MADESTSLELRPPPPPGPLLPRPWAIPAWEIGAGAGILLVLVLLIIWLRRRRKSIDPNFRRKQAYREAKRLLEEARPPAAREAATISSLVLRRFLAIVSEDPALFETHEEFIGRHDSLANLPPDVRTATVGGFDHLAAMKYGKTTPADEPAAVIGSARTLLDQLNRAFAA